MQEFFLKLKIDKFTIVMFIEFWKHEAEFFKLDINWVKKVTEFFLHASWNPLCYSDQSANFQLMRDLGMVGRLLHIMKDNQLTAATIRTISSVITVLLQGTPDPGSMLK